MRFSVFRRGCAIALVTSAFALVTAMGLFTSSRPAMASGCEPSLFESAVDKLTPDELNAVLSVPLAVAEGYSAQLTSGGSTTVYGYPGVKHVHQTFLEMLSAIQRPAMFLGPDGQEYASWNGFMESIGQTGIAPENFFFCGYESPE